MQSIVVSTRDLLQCVAPTPDPRAYSGRFPATVSQRFAMRPPGAVPARTPVFTLSAFAARAIVSQRFEEMSSVRVPAFRPPGLSGDPFFSCASPPGHARHNLPTGQGPGFGTGIPVESGRPFGGAARGRSAPRPSFPLPWKALVPDGRLAAEILPRRKAGVPWSWLHDRDLAHNPGDVLRLHLAQMLDIGAQVIAEARTELPGALSNLFHDRAFFRFHGMSSKGCKRCGVTMRGTARPMRTFRISSCLALCALARWRQFQVRTKSIR